MPQSLTELGCWNKAAYKIGAQRFIATDVTNPSGSSNPNANFFADVWEQSVDEVLEEHPFSFAVQTVPLIPLNPPVWTSSTAYSAGNYVINGNNIYIALTSFTSATTFAADLALGYWKLQVLSPSVPVPINSWAANTAYLVGMYVQQAGAIYLCLIQNTSSASFATDLAAGYWMIQSLPVSPAVWAATTAYVAGAYVQQGTNIYICLISYTSSSSFATDLAAGYWQIQSVLPLLQALPNINDPCQNPYAIPSDFISTYKFENPTYYRKEKIKPPYVSTSTQVLLLSNSNVGSWKYVFENLTVSDWSAKFYEAVATKLAYNLCFKISEAAQYAAALKAEYDKALISAIADDSNTSSPDRAIADEWEIARLQGSNGGGSPWGITPSSPAPEPY